MLNHLYQIMIRRLRPLYLKTFGHLASHYGKEIRYTSKAYSYPYRLRFSKYVLKHLYQIIIRSYWGHLYYSLIDMPKKKKKKFNYDTYICIKLIDQKIRFLRKKMDLGGGGKITIDYRPKESKFEFHTPHSSLRKSFSRPKCAYNIKHHFDFFGR